MVATTKIVATMTMKVATMMMAETTVLEITMGGTIMEGALLMVNL